MTVKWSIALKLLVNLTRLYRITTANLSQTHATVSNFICSAWKAKTMNPSRILAQFLIVIAFSIVRQIHVLERTDRKSNMLRQNGGGADERYSLPGSIRRVDNL